MSRWKYYNPNPKRLRVGDCTVRAISKAMGIDWETVFVGMYVQACVMSNMPSANCVWGQYLEKAGWKKRLVNKRGKDRYTVEDFCEDHPHGIYILGTGEHVVCVSGGFYWDTWDSGQELPIYYFTR